MSESKDFEFEDIEEENQIQKDENIPSYGESGWEEYVLSMFDEKELYTDSKGNSFPSLNGLRRVALKVLGPVVSSRPVVINSELPITSYCIYELVFEDGSIYGAAADAHPNNISGNYDIYPTTIAESRAEARAYRKALLISTASAEEIKGNEESFNSVLSTTGGYDETGPMTDQQKEILKTKCKQLKINMVKFLESESVNLDTAKREDAAKLMQKISEFQKTEVPKELK